MGSRNHDVFKYAREPFTEPSEEEKKEDNKIWNKAYNNIPDYPEGEHPSLEEIRVAEKVLKYVSKCEYIGFTQNDLRAVLGSTTNILRWNFKYPDLYRDN